MIAHVLMNVFKRIGERDKMRGFLKFMSRIHTTFERFKAAKFFIFNHFTHLLAIESSC